MGIGFVEARRSTWDMGGGRWPGLVNVSLRFKLCQLLVLLCD